MLYKFCPICGGSLVSQELNRENVPVCQNSSCGFIFWQNSKPCASVLIPDNQGRILMTVRAKEPDKGKLDLPGGFLQLGEHPDEGAKREIKEELGVEIEIDDYVGLVIDRYGQDGEFTLNIGVVAKITKGTPQAADDAAAIEWLDPRNILLYQLAFTNNQKFLELWIALKVLLNSMHLGAG
jgi:ADP-ribose pyrophosphatase YjhB (NUDIX family)